MFFRKKKKAATEKEYRGVFYGPMTCSLIDIGIPKQYAEGITDKAISQAIDEFKNMEMSKYLSWRLENEFEEIKKSLKSKEVQTHA